MDDPDEGRLQLSKRALTEHSQDCEFDGDVDAERNCAVYDLLIFCVKHATSPAVCCRVRQNGRGMFVAAHDRSSVHACSRDTVSSYRRGQAAAVLSNEGQDQRELRKNGIHVDFGAPMVCCDSAVIHEAVFSVSGSLY